MNAVNTPFKLLENSSQLGFTTTLVFISMLVDTFSPKHIAQS